MAEKKKQEKLIQRVWENKGNKQKLVTIPKESEIKAGDLVEIEKVGIKMDDGHAKLGGFKSVIRKEIMEILKQKEEGGS